MLGLVRGDRPLLVARLSAVAPPCSITAHFGNQGLEHIQYSGIDLRLGVRLRPHRLSSPRWRFMKCRYFKRARESVSKADYIVMNGVLTEKQSLSFDDMWAYSQALLPLIFQKCNIGMAFQRNVQSS